ncbi:hypothetical protein FOZ63_023257, partial [Perkinsus olseni]
RLDTINFTMDETLLRIVMGGAILPGLMLCSSMGAMQLRYGEFSSSALAMGIPDQLDNSLLSQLRHLHKAMQSPIHCKYPEDDLNAKAMNIKPGGKQPRMRAA